MLPAIRFSDKHHFFPVSYPKPGAFPAFILGQAPSFSGLLSEARRFFRLSFSDKCRLFPAIYPKPGAFPAFILGQVPSFSGHLSETRRISGFHSRTSAVFFRLFIRSPALFRLSFSDKRRLFLAIYPKPGAFPAFILGQAPSFSGLLSEARRISVFYPRFAYISS